MSSPRWHPVWPPLLILIAWISGNPHGLTAASPTLNVTILPDQTVRLAWPADAGDYLLEQLDRLESAEAWQPVTEVPVPDGLERAVTLAPGETRRFFRLREGVRPLVTLATSSPLPGEMGVAVTRETILHLTAPLAADAVVTTNHFYAGVGGRRLLSRIEVASSRDRVTLFYLEPLPGGARAVAVFDGTGLKDAAGRFLDADGDGVEGGLAVIPFETLSNTPVPGTAVSGRVFASELVPGPDTGTNAVNKPLAGVTITVDGMEQTLRAVTDAQGQFTLQPVPPGRFFVHIDGRTVREGDRIRYPDRSYYPFVGKAWEAVAGRTNPAGGTGEIFLPLITEGTMQTVSATQDTVIGFPANVISNNPALAGVSITVPANALYGDNGARGGKVGIAPVPPDRLPGPLPPGLEMPIVITVQTDGPLNFDRPAPVCFPNLPDPVLKTSLPAGSKQALVSFNHDKGEWEAVGTMTVSADGKLVCTDPGSGILQPGWHGFMPLPVLPPGLPQPNPRPPPKDCEDDPVQLNLCYQQCIIRETLCLLDAVKYKYDLLDECGFFFGKTFTDCPDQVYAVGDFLERNCRRLEQDCELACARCFRRPAESEEPNRAGGAVRPSGVDDDPVVGIVREIYERIRPYAESYSPIPPEILAAVTELRAQADALAGGNATAYLAARRLTAEEEAFAAAAAIGLEFDDLNPGNEPAYPVRYAATVVRPDGILVLRGETGPYGQYALFIPRDGRLKSVSFYDPLTQRFGFITPRLSPRAPSLVPRFTLLPIEDEEPDHDEDNLPDIVEHVYGTDPTRADSDEDGVIDGAEVSQGSNPLDGRPVITGIIASAPAVGAAVDVWAGDSVVATAEGTAGVSLFSPYDGVNPTRLVHVATPGNAQRITGSGPFVLVATGDTGVSVLDVSDPLAVRHVHQISLPGAQALAAASGTAYVGLASGGIVAVDLWTGTVLSGLSVTNAVWDLAVTGDHLYALTENRLFAIRLGAGGLELAGSAATPFSAAPNRRLFVGGGTAYTVHGRGYNTFDLASPALPVLLTTGNTTQFGWKQIVANGTGLGLAALGPNSIEDKNHNVSLYDLRDPRTNDLFLNTFITPGIARAVAIHNGLGYVADDTAGLQVVNYFAFDARRTPPTVELQPGFPNEGVTEGSRVWVAARVTDDVQVRHVEFLLDGQPVNTDGSFPFEFRFTAPARTASQTNFTVQARAVDTGGNARLSEVLVVPLLPDTTPPAVLAHHPIGGARNVDRLQVVFGEAPNPPTLTTNSFVLHAAGADGVLGTADDLSIGGGTITVSAEGGGAVLAFGQPLPEGLYRATVAASVTDRFGNALGTDLTWSFRVGNAVFWTGRIDDRWANPLNWSEGRLPGPDDAVVIDPFDGPITVVHDLDTSRVRSLVTHARLQVGTAARRSLLRVDETLRMQGDLLLDGGGTIQGATIQQPGEGRIRVTNRGGTLDGVTVQGDLVLTNTGARLLIRNGLQLSGTVRIDNGSAIGFTGDQSLDGGTVVFEGNSGFLSIDGNSTVTFGPEVVIRGKTGAITSGVFSGSGFPRLVNRGRMGGDVAGSALAIGLWTFENAGTLEVAQGNTLLMNSQNWTNRGQITVSTNARATLAGNWGNAGTFILNEGTLSLGGDFTAAGLGVLQRTGGTIELVNGGNLNLAGGTLKLDAAMGSWAVKGGTIRGGTVVQEEGARLVFSNQGGVLDGLTVEGDLDLTVAGTGVSVRNGLTLNGTARLNNSGALTVLGDQTLHRGTIEFAGGSGVVRIEGNATWTLGPEVVVRGGTGGIGQGFSAGSSRLINQGLMVVDRAGSTLTLVPGRLENPGTLRADGDGATLLIRVPGFTPSGTIEEVNGGRVLINP